jgi:branched-chain amino acid transport system ATP-binding protein
MLEVSHLDVKRGRLQVLWDVSLSAQAGEMSALIGANGAGKSTLLQAIACLLHPAGGSVVFDGVRVNKLTAHDAVKRGICLVLEGKRVFPGMSVLDNLGLGAYSARARKSRAKNLAKVYQTFPRLEARKNQMAETLSGGEQQMLVIARGLMSEPKLMMLDEVSSGVAPLVTGEIFRVMTEINKSGVTILIVEQNVALAVKAADRAYIIEGGRVVGHGNSKELLEDKKVIEAYLGS